METQRPRYWEVSHAYPQSYHAFVAVGLGVVLLREGTLLLVSVADQLMANPASKKRSLSHRLEFKDFLAQYLLCISAPKILSLNSGITWEPCEIMEITSFGRFGGPKISNLSGGCEIVYILPGMNVAFILLAMGRKHHQTCCISCSNVTHYGVHESSESMWQPAWVFAKLKLWFIALFCQCSFEKV